MFLYKPKKTQKNQNAKGDRMLITVNVFGSAGPLRFVVYKEELVSQVIGTVLKQYARQRRLPVLGTDVDDFALYYPQSAQPPQSWETIGSLGARNFLLGKKPLSEKVVKIERDGKASDAVSRKRTGVWKSRITKALKVKISFH